MPKRLAQALFLIAAFLVPAASVDAQPVQRIAAVVNDEIVSVQDLRNRIQMVIVTSQLPRTNETAQRLAPQVLRSLIDEQLQLQEAKRENIEVTETDMAKARSDVEARNGLRPGQFDAFVERLGVAKATVERQLRANLAWAQLVRRRFAGQVEVSQEEVDETLARLESQVGKEQKRVSEILLSVDDPTKEAEIAQLADRLVGQLRSGASFASVARQFSNAANANVGGDIGWVLTDQLSPELAEVVATLDKNVISDPVRTVFGYSILQVSDTRVLAEPDPDAALVRLAQAFLPVQPGDDTALRASQRNLVQTLGTSAGGSCEALGDLARQAGSKVKPHLGESRLGELPANLRAPVSALKVGEVSDPIDLPNGVMVVMMCERKNPPTNLPEPEQIRLQLETQRFEVLAQRYLRDLRQTAFVETRV